MTGSLSSKPLAVIVLTFLTLGGVSAMDAPAAVAASVDDVLKLMPVPASMTVRDGRYRIDDTLAIVHASTGDPKGVVTSRAFRAAARFMSRLAGRTGLFLKQDFLLTQVPSSAGGIRYAYGRPGALLPNEDESYSLTVDPDKVTLEAKTDIGVLRGFETLLQLLSADETGYYFPCVAIADQPRFTWRGLLIDVGRHFQPVDVIKRNLDAMAAVKMNVLHWHLTEDQGFRVESKVFPKLHQLGSDGMFYTQQQIRDIIAFAGDRGIRVMPEFDIPGHSTSWFVAYPEFSSAPGTYGIERKFGVFGPAFNPADERIYPFLDAFLKEMSALFPDPYLHIGGDEVEGHQWDANPAIQAFKKKNGLADNGALQAYFNRRLLKILTKYGKKMVGWDEVFQPGLPNDIVIHSWRGPKSLVEAAQKGYQGILSNGYYIDLCQSAESHYLNDPLPPDSLLNDLQKALILGGEATMWSELVTPETIDSRIWPRTAAIAERLWSPASVTNVDDMYRRLGPISVELEELGLLHLKNPDMLFRRLAGGPRIEPLQVLAEAVEPLKNYQRHGQAAYTSLSPFTRFVDACAPESFAARSFRKKVDQFLAGKDPTVGRGIGATLALWKANHVRVLPLIAASPALREIEPLSLGLARACEVGLEALDLIMRGERQPAAWAEEKGKILAEAAKPAAHAELAVISAVTKLVAACAGPVK
ncbi:MAG: family 20 glycosylhydrolase [Candidatus Aminicenantes bacterium]|nr:family 20 glycosylhydrolase [Candidatus Aminicenantes bacterium]